jgi:hypothetical protein
MLPFTNAALLIPAPGGAGTGLSNRWRLNITAVWGGGASQTSISEIEMRSSPGGADQCNGGTATASLGAGTASVAFDNVYAVGSNRWASGSTTRPVQIEYQFPSNVTIQQIYLLPYSISDKPTAFTVEYF